MSLKAINYLLRKLKAFRSNCKYCRLTFTSDVSIKIRKCIKSRCKDCILLSDLTKFMSQNDKSFSLYESCKYYLRVIYYHIYLPFLLKECNIILMKLSLHGKIHQIVLF